MNPGTIVTCRNRDWVLLPHKDPNILLLRPLTGPTDEVVAIHKGLADLAGWDKLSPALQQTVQGRAEALAEAHRRIRQAVSLKVRGLTVKPQMPPDLLGVLVLQPVIGHAPTA